MPGRKRIPVSKLWRVWLVHKYYGIYSHGTSERNFPCFFTAVFLVNLSVLGYGYYFSTTIDIELLMRDRALG